MHKFYLFLAICLITNLTNAQTDIKAWYAQGQVWIVWKTAKPYPESYVIYKNTQAFSTVSQANPIGRLFAYEYLPGSMIQYSANINFKYKIPKPDGSIYQLQENECLFVETVISTGSAYYGVVEWGNLNFVSNVNIINSPVNYNFDPINEPVNCHLQISETINTGHRTNWYSLWLLGKSDESSGRPDFPVMANVFKNGMPAMFIVSEAIGMDTSKGKKIPGTIWLHGGGGNASNYLPNNAKQFDVEPKLGISVSHTDDVPQKFFINGDTVLSTARSAWFGWTKRQNPFNPMFNAGPGDTIINYTQRRLLWVNNWLIQHYNLDQDRIALQGYSMGSGGVSALAKCFPNLFSTVCAFNNGFRRVNEETITGIQGTVEENLPTNVYNARNENVHINEIMDINTPCSSFRDYPLVRTWAGKNDVNDRMFWGPDLIKQYRKADSIGWGIQISWDEREHVYNTLGVHWIDDLGQTNQTYLDNLSTQENFSRKMSFPAFYNHQMDSKNNDPGTGKMGINNGDGDNWGTWGGYHSWDLSSIEDTKYKWAVTTWLNNQQLFTNDNCPENELNSSLAIRKPQLFKPRPGAQLKWKSEDLGNGQILSSGNLTVGPDSLVSIPNVTVYNSAIRKIRISIEDLQVGIESDHSFIDIVDMKIYPNPSKAEPQLEFYSKQNDRLQLCILSLYTTISHSDIQIQKGINQIKLKGTEALAPGIYRVVLKSKNDLQLIKWIKI